MLMKIYIVLYNTGKEKVIRLPDNYKLLYTINIKEL